MEPAQGDDFYRIEAIQSCPLVSHRDFITLPQVYTLRSTHGGQIRRLELPKNAAWSVGSLVRINPSQFLAGAF